MIYLTGRRLFFVFAVTLMLVLGAGCSSSSSPSDTNSTETDTPANTPGDQVLSDPDTTTPEQGTDSLNTAAPEDAAPEDAISDDTTPGEDIVDTDVNAGLLISADNTNALILQAFEVYSGRAYDSRMTRFPYTTTEDYELTPGSGQTAERITFADCGNNGQLTKLNNSVDFGYSVEGVFSDCLVNGDTLNGRIRMDNGGRTSNHYFQREYLDNFTVTFQPNGRMTLSGIHQQAKSLSLTNIFNVEQFNFELSYPGGSLSVSNASTMRSVRLDGYQIDSEPLALLSGSFSMQPPLLNGTTVTVETSEPFINEITASGLRYETGVMVLSDGVSQIVVNADTGNINTVLVTVTINGESSITREEPWSVWRDALAYVPPNANASPKPNLTTQRGDVITAENAELLLRETFDVLTGDLFGSDILNLPEYTFPDFPAGYLQAGTPDGAQEWGTQSCSNGGSVDLESFKFGARQITSGWNATFNDCDQNGLRYSGRFLTRHFGNFFYVGDEFSITSQNRSVFFDGTLDYKHTSNRDGGPSRHYGLNGSVTRVIQNAADLSVVERKVLEAQTYFQAVLGFNISMVGDFYLQSPSSQSEALYVSILDPLLHRNQFGGLIEQYTFGTLVIKAGQGNELVLNATNGDASTFDLTVRQGGQVTYRSTEVWSDWPEALSFNFDLHQR